MRIKISNNYIKIGSIVFLLAGLSLFAIGKYIKYNHVEIIKNKSAIVSSNALEYDSVVVKRFTEVSAKLDANVNNFFLSGTLTSINGADSSETVIEATYILNKKGNNLYYRLGETETINNNGVYVFVDHISKKIIISKEKAVSASPGLPDMKNLLKGLKGEGYQLVVDKVKETERISVVNENHITCKMYRIAFDPISLAPKQIYLRLSDVEAPADKTKDKIIEINIKECGQIIKDEQFDISRLIKKEQSAWIPAKAYRTYEVIVI